MIYSTRGRRARECASRVQKVGLDRGGKCIIAHLPRDVALLPL